MKVYAESQAPKEMPFVHLGYLASTSHIDAPGFIGFFGSAMLCLGAVLLVGKGRSVTAGTRRQVLLSLSALLAIMGVAGAVMTVVILGG